MNYSLIIPVYNEERSLPKLLKDLSFLIKTIEIIIVNDGSDDNTKNILKTAKNIIIINNQNNLGKGNSIKKGLDRASSKNIILFDGDLEVSTRNIPSLIKDYENIYPNILAGSRWGDKPIPMNNINNVGNFLINKIFNILFKSKINDVLCCVKIIKKDILKSINIESGGFSVEVEIMSKVLLINQTIFEKKIDYNRRSTKEGKKLKISNGWNIIFVMVQIFCKNIFKDKYFLSK